MTKQEFLAMSLPYQLKVKVLCGDGVFDTIDTLTIGNLYELGANRIKPIVRPLSDLTKPIEHKGEKFVPYKKLDWEFYSGELGEYISFGDMHSGVINVLGYLSQLQLLLSWHFDIADLISKGEAINVNTLETNPYK